MTDRDRRMAVWPAFMGFSAGVCLMGAFEGSWISILAIFGLIACVIWFVLHFRSGDTVSEE